MLLINLGIGKYFGEQALESKNGFRSATVTANLLTKLLVLHADDYNDIFRQYKEGILLLLLLLSLFLLLLL